MPDFKVISPYEINDNIFKLIDRDHMLITAKNSDEKVNTMTASWGGAGILWGKPIAIAFIRPERYTYEFVEDSDRMTLSFFDEYYRETLTFCGTRSGRNMDKITLAGLTTLFDESGAPYFAEAKTVLVCRKMYADMISPENMIDMSNMKHYQKNGFHKMYICEIEKVFVR